MKSETPYHLIAKYFAEQCSEAEKKEIAGWRNSNTENELLFLQLKHEWNDAEHIVYDYNMPDKEIVWNKIQKGINRKKTRKISSFVSAACVAVLFILGLSGIYFHLNKSAALPNEQVLLVFAPSGQKSKMILPDSTVVWLNSGSCIEYSSLFNIQNRKVSIKGEAFFEVKKSTEHPFVVSTNAVDIKVMGTTFNVKAFEADDEVSVALIEGNVNLISQQTGDLIASLNPNQSASISKSDLTCSISECDAESEGIWHLNKFYADNLPADQVWKKLGNWYGVSIKVYNTKPNQTYRFIIKTESLTEFLELINRLTPIDYKLNGEEVTVVYK